MRTIIIEKTHQEGKPLDIDLNQMSHRYVSGVLQNETSTSAHLIDRCENVNNVEKKSTSNMLSWKH